ncbi:unnamed protein product, partial [Meganyctiphanes norvegica]
MGNLFSSETPDGIPTSISGESLDDASSSCDEVLSARRLQAVLQQGPPYPQVVLPPEDYWQEENSSDKSADGDGFHVNNIATDDDIETCYRKYFVGKEHWNFVGEDEFLGPVVLSYKTDDEQGSQMKACVLLRLNCSTHYSIIDPGDSVTPATLAKAVRDDLTLERLDPVVTPIASSLLLGFDEHALRQSFKFGVIYQLEGQTTEDQLFANRKSSPAMEQFLNYIGHRVKLSEHKGYMGGLKSQGTGKESVYVMFSNNEIMFHVSTLLPFDVKNSELFSRLVHLRKNGKEIVLINRNSPFVSTTSSAHFLYAMLLISPFRRCVDESLYCVSVVARDGVPPFGPPLPPEGQFLQGPDLKDFLLNKLINAHLACLKAPKFASLEKRTRNSFICILVEDLQQNTKQFLGFSVPYEVPKSERRSSTRFIDIVRLMMEKRRKETGTQIEIHKDSSKSRTNSRSEFRITSRKSRSSKGSIKSKQEQSPPASPEIRRKSSMVSPERNGLFSPTSPERKQSPPSSPEKTRQSPTPCSERTIQSPSPSLERTRPSPPASPKISRPEITRQSSPFSPERTKQSPPSSPEKTRQSPTPSPERTRQSPSASPERTRQSPSASPERTRPPSISSPERTRQSPSASPEMRNLSPVPYSLNNGMSFEKPLNLLSNSKNEINTQIRDNINHYSKSKNISLTLGSIHLVTKQLVNPILSESDSVFLDSPAIPLEGSPNINLPSYTDITKSPNSSLKAVICTNSGNILVNSLNSIDFTDNHSALNEDSDTETSFLIQSNQENGLLNHLDTGIALSTEVYTWMNKCSSSTVNSQPKPNKNILTDSQSALNEDSDTEMNSKSPSNSQTDLLSHLDTERALPTHYYTWIDSKVLGNVLSQPSPQQLKLSDNKADLSEDSEPGIGSMSLLNPKTYLLKHLDTGISLSTNCDNLMDLNKPLSIVSQCTQKQSVQPALNENSLDNELTSLTHLESGISSMNYSETGISSLNHSDSGLSSFNHLDLGMNSLSSENEMSQSKLPKAICLHCEEYQVVTCDMHIDHQTALKEITKLNEEIDELKNTNLEFIQKNQVSH